MFIFIFYVMKRRNVPMMQLRNVAIGFNINDIRRLECADGEITQFSIKFEDLLKIGKQHRSVIPYILLKFLFYVLCDVTI